MRAIQVAASIEGGIACGGDECGEVFKYETIIIVR